MKLSKEAYRAVEFARACILHNIEPHDLAKLMTASKAYTAAAVRACNQPDYNTDRQEKALNKAAQACGVERVIYPGLVAQFVMRDGKILRPVHFGA